VETNPMRLVAAVNNYCYAAKFEEALEQVKVIFCATGAKSFKIQDFRKIRNGAILVSVTSSDDEFDLSLLADEYKQTKISPYLTLFSCERNYFYIINNGNAVNFLFGAALGNFIFLVMAEMLLIAKLFAEKSSQYTTAGLIDLDINRDVIA
jgi:adenosylhomocysteinase